MAGVRGSKAATQMQSLRETISALRALGVTDEKIAERTGMSVPDMRLLKVDRAFTPEEDRLILDQRVKARFWIRIAEMLGDDCTADDVKIRYDWLIRKQLRGERTPVAAHIMCLGRCGKKFHTPDRVRTRMCESCQKIAQTIAGGEATTWMHSATGRRDSGT